MEQQGGENEIPILTKEEIAASLGYEPESCSSPSQEQRKLSKRKREEEIPDSVATRDELPPELKKQESPNPEDEKIAFFKSRLEDFKVFLQRRIPPDNEVAQQYLQDFISSSEKDFALELINTVSKLQMIGGMTLIFTRLCTKANMKAEDFIDRSVERPDLVTEKQKKDQLTWEITDFHEQLKELLKLAKELPEKFYQ
jgi:hypothetical protein